MEMHKCKVEGDETRKSGTPMSQSGLTAYGSLTAQHSKGGKSGRGGENFERTVRVLCIAPSDPLQGNASISVRKLVVWSRR